MGRGHTWHILLNFMNIVWWVNIWSIMVKVARLLEKKVTAAAVEFRACNVTSSQVVDSVLLLFYVFLYYLVQSCSVL